MNKCSGYKSYLYFSNQFYSKSNRFIRFFFGGGESMGFSRNRMEIECDKSLKYELVSN